MDINAELKASILQQPFFRGKIVTSSMSPVIKVGEEILVEVKTRDLKRFDIVVFVRDGKLICHYLWIMNRFLEPQLMQTRSLKGVRDFPISQEEYVGKVVSHRLSWWRILKIILLK